MTEAQKELLAALAAALFDNSPPNSLSPEWGSMALFNCLLPVHFGFFLAECRLRRGKSVGIVRMAALNDFAYSILLELFRLVHRCGA